MSHGFTHRLATEDDMPALHALMEAAIDHLQSAFLDPDQVVASHEVMGIDTQLIADGTYFCLFEGETLVGCGGWSGRRTLFGGDHSTALRAPERLDPTQEAARVRAMYTHPDHVRRGVGQAILDLAEAAARAAGFRRAQLMSTLAGEPLYARAGYRPIERADHRGSNGAVVPLILMEKPLA